MTLAAADLHSPDPVRRDAAAQRIWDRYSNQLLALAKRRLDPRVQRRAGADDVLQSAFGSFFDGQATLNSREDLWRLLVRITLCKAANTGKFHTAARRDVHRDQPFAAAGAEEDEPILELMDERGPTAVEALVLTEELDGWLEPLAADLRQVAQWRLEGHSNKEIGEKLGRTERAVEMKLQRIRQRLEERYRALFANQRNESAGPAPGTSSYERP